MFNKNIVVWFSCGAASAVAAILTVNKYNATNNVRLVCSSLKEEHNDNMRFALAIQEYTGITIEFIAAKKYPNNSIFEVFEDRSYISGIQGAPCTRFLKKQARYEFEKSNVVDYHVLGFTFDEQHRHARFIKSERSNVLPVLINNKFTKGKCFEFLKSANIPLPGIYKLNYPNANCVVCVKSSSPAYWSNARKHFPFEFEKMCALSRRLNCKLVVLKGKRIFLNELPIREFGKPRKSFDCGIFCDEY